MTTKKILTEAHTIVTQSVLDGYSIMANNTIFFKCSIIFDTDIYFVFNVLYLLYYILYYIHDLLSFEFLFSNPFDFI